MLACSSFLTVAPVRPPMPSTLPTVVVFAWLLLVDHLRGPCLSFFAWDKQIGNNLKYWPDNHEVVSRTLQLFLDMASGYSSSKMLLGLDTVKFLMRNHTAEFFPFLVRCRFGFLCIRYEVLYVIVPPFYK